MSQETLPSPLRQEDYEAIEAAVMETARGRWFLTEYARRNRSSDTRTVLDAIGRLENAMLDRQDIAELQALRRAVVDMSSAITRAKEEIGAGPLEGEHERNRLGEASIELDSVIRETEKATSEILLAAEAVQEVAWTLREQGIDSQICDRLDVNATNVYTACSFQDLTGQRTAKVIQALRYVEARLNAVIDLLGMDPASSAGKTLDGAEVSAGVRDAPETLQDLETFAPGSEPQSARAMVVLEHDEADAADGTEVSSRDEHNSPAGGLANTVPGVELVEFEDVIAIEDAPQEDVDFETADRVEDTPFQEEASAPGTPADTDVVAQAATGKAAPCPDGAGDETEESRLASRDENGQETGPSASGRLEAMSDGQRLALFS